MTVLPKTLAARGESIMSAAGGKPRTGAAGA
jgi:hypothetical protein